MKGIRIVTAEDGIIIETNRVGTMMLKAKDGNQEVVHIRVLADKNMVMSPYHCDGAMFTCYIISGSFLHVGSKEVLGAGDCFSVKDLENPEYFKSLEDSEVIFISNKKYFEKQTAILRQFTDQMAVIQEKDEYTEKHCDRSGNLAMQIAMKFGFTDHLLEDIFYVGKVHDIGKIKIADEILNKKSKLSEGEFQLMKKHVLYGYDMIKHAFSEEAVKVQLYHHERLDGSGYPFGLKGDEIPLQARIMAVADCYDAMISDRPYRKGLTPEAAILELVDEVDTHYDRQVVEKLIEILVHEGKLKERVWF